MDCKSCGRPIPGEDEQIEYCEICAEESIYADIAEARHEYFKARADELFAQFDALRNELLEMQGKTGEDT
jgi:hypothetical protein